MENPNLPDWYTDNLKPVASRDRHGRIGAFIRKSLAAFAQVLAEEFQSDSRKDLRICRLEPRAKILGFLV
ncbi:MAG TPA: hypothetical protein VGK34_05410, partial [Armatimonadota bacterium]